MLGNYNPRLQGGRCMPIQCALTGPKYKTISFFQAEPLSIDCGGVGGSSAASTSLLSTTSQWMNDANNEEDHFASTIDVDAIKARNQFLKLYLYFK